MEIEVESYSHGMRFETGAYIQRHYLPVHYRKELQPRDIEVLYNRIMSAYWNKPLEEIYTDMLDEPCIIRYQDERLIKGIPSDLLKTVIDACHRYCHDNSDYELTASETDSLIELNGRLIKLEHDLNTECYRLNQEMQVRQEQGLLFSDSYEIEVILNYQLRDDHPLFCDDDSIIYEVHCRKTANYGRITEWVCAVREGEERDWNDTYGAANPYIRNNTLFNMPHCWFFHDMQSRSPIPLKHLCGIGRIWAEIQVVYQGVLLCDSGKHCVRTC